MFKFWPTKHSVVQAAFGFPCIPNNMIHHDAPTFNSGWKPVDIGSDDVRHRSSNLASQDND